MRFLLAFLMVSLPVLPAGAQSAWPMFGGTPARNMVNTADKGLRLDFKVEEGKRRHVKWVAELGSKCYGGPVVAGGKVYVATNNANPRDPKEKGNLAVLQCYDVAKGAFLWQITHPMPDAEIFEEFTGVRMGLVSTPAIDGDRLYYVTPDAKVVCATTAGKIEWSYDMMKELKVVPHHCSNCSPMVVDDRVFLMTGNGTGPRLGDPVTSPEAPSFVALSKKEGKLLWKSNLPGKNIIEGQWSNPALALVDGKKQVVFPGGDGVLYSFDALGGDLVWKFNCHPKGARSVEGEPIPNYFVATPVFHDNKVYVAMGTYPEHPKAGRDSYLFCVDATKKGDVSPRSLDHKAKENAGSALVWAYGGSIEPRPKKGRPVIFSPSLSTCAIHNGLLFIGEETGYIHCLDAATGTRHWMFDFKSAIWGSPYVVDGKVLCGVEDGMLHVVNADKKFKILLENEKGERSFVDTVASDESPGINMGELIHSTPVVAGGVLYVVTRSKLYAIAP